MKALRWLRTKWPIPLSDVSKKMLSRQYTEKTGRGFLLTTSSKNKLAGQFIEKSNERILTADPFGNQIESHVITYYVVKFEFDNSSNLLELNTPPKSLRKLASELHSLFGLGMELSDIKIDPWVWLEEIESTLSPVSVLHISASGITTSINGLAKISVSGKKDIRNDFLKLTGNKPKIIDSVKFKGHFEDCNILVELTKTGTIKLSGQIYDGFESKARNCLAACLARMAD